MSLGKLLAACAAVALAAAPAFAETATNSHKPHHATQAPTHAPGHATAHTKPGPTHMASHAKHPPTHTASRESKEPTHREAAAPSHGGRGSASDHMADQLNSRELSTSRSGSDMGAAGGAAMPGAPTSSAGGMTTMPTPTKY